MLHAQYTYIHTTIETGSQNKRYWLRPRKSKIKIYKIKMSCEKNQIEKIDIHFHGFLNKMHLVRQLYKMTRDLT